MHKVQTRSGYAQREAKYNLCFLSKVLSRAGKKQAGQGARKEREIS